jgi:hypothetical protein
MLPAALATAFTLAACGGSAGSSGTSSPAPTKVTVSTPTAPVTVKRPAPPPPPPPPPPYPVVRGIASSSLPTSFVPAVTWQAQTATSIARTPSGVALLSFDQHVVSLTLHSGAIDAGAEGWRFGPAVSPEEAPHLVAGFNGGFKFSTGAGGFESYGHVGAPLHDGLGSIVTYTDGQTDIGSWHGEVPASGRLVASVRQNLTLLIDHGVPASTLGCLSCWGATLGGVVNPARSALGVTADGHLIWAGGEHLTASGLANVLLGAQVVRAVELDINPEWVAAYVYRHRGERGPLAPVSVVPGQPGVPGKFLAPDSRDFFTVVAR